MADYSQQWRDYRKRRNLAIVGIIWFLVAPFVVPRALDHLHLADGWYFVALIASSLLAVPPFVWLLQFRCPRCGENFTLKGWWAQNVVARKCERCGLAKYSGG
jgi:membrane protease YdiL (CAAX protease family)